MQRQRIHSACSPAAARAFTLVELLVVVLAIGILAAVSVPRYAAALDRCRAEGAAFRIQHDLRFAQAIARSTSKPVTVVFSKSANQYELVGQSDVHRPGRPFRVTLSDCETPAVLAAVNIDGGTALTFDMDGRPYAGTDTAKPLQTATITVNSGGQSRTIHVERTTGKVTIQ